MYRSIVVPLDTSPFAEQVIPTAVGIARRSGATLHTVLVHVPMPPVHADAAPSLYHDWNRKAYDFERGYLDSMLERMRGTGDVSVEAALLEGDVEDALVEYVDRNDADLVAMTTHGRGGLNRMWLGSIADALIRRSPVPMLLFHPREEELPPPTEIDMRHILIPMDGSDLAASIIDHAVRLGSLTSASYTLLRVLPASMEVGGHVFHLDESRLERARERASEAIMKQAKRLREAGHDVRTEVHTHPFPSQAIPAWAEEHDVDLIAIATHGRKGLSRMVLGSVTDKVIRGTSIPTLTYRPRGRT